MRQLAKRLVLLAATSGFLLVVLTPSISAMSQAQKDVFNLGINYFDVDPSETCSTTPSNTIVSTGGGDSSQSLAFARESITSTWGISDSSIEQWFLKQPSAGVVITKFGLSSSNIGEITSAVKAAGVSPVYFYLYTVNEGGGLGGFINHYTNDAPGGGVANAKRDAEYIASQAQKTGDNPAWIDVDHYVDFVPQDVKDAGDADFKNMPTGTIGRIYIPATAAAAWEVYYPNGLKKEYNGVADYGPPLAGTMINIRGIGGDPLAGDINTTSGGCNSSMGVTGEGMAKGISWAIMIANNDGYGYDQITDSDQVLPGDARTTGWTKWQSDPNCTKQCGSFDCSSFISTIITVAGYTNSNPNFATSNEASVLAGLGFNKIADSATTSKDLLPGDILITNGHTEMYIGNNQNVGAHINDIGDINGGLVGDQTGKEISVTPFYNDNWTSVWRAPN